MVLLVGLIVALAVLPATAVAAPVLVSGDGRSMPVAISDDGRHALFNTEEGDERISHAYVRDVNSGALELVMEANGNVLASDMSADGRFVSRNGRWALLGSNRDNVFAGGV
jgi:hypothetical protein